MRNDDQYFLNGSGNFDSMTLFLKLKSTPGSLRNYIMLRNNARNNKSCGITKMINNKAF